MLAIRIRDNIFLCGMEPETYDQIRLSIMAASKCGFAAREELADSYHIRVLYMMGVGPILLMSWGELSFLMAIMVHISTEEIGAYNPRIIHEILGMLTCVMEQAVEPTPET